MIYTVQFSGALIVDAPNAKAADEQLQQMTGDEILECIEEDSAKAATPEEVGVHRLIQGDFEEEDDEL
jgi:hypothetical protein